MSLKVPVVLAFLETRPHPKATKSPIYLTGIQEIYRHPHTQRALGLMWQEPGTPDTQLCHNSSSQNWIMFTRVIDVGGRIVETRRSLGN